MGNMMRSQRNGDRMVPHSDDRTLKASEEDTLVVLEDYPHPDVSEPIFRKGERLRGLAEDRSCWKVRSLQTGSENYIPFNHVAKVYHGWLFEGVGRAKAEELLWLPGNTTGSFLIRESLRDRGMYCLSVRHRTIKHYKIFRLANSWFYISPRLTFQCLEDLVNQYSDCSDGICCVLVAPCLAQSTNTTSHPALTSSVPPVVMRRNFDWRVADRSQFIRPSDQECPEGEDSLVSYGVRNSIASYLSLTGHQDPEEDSSRRKRKNKSVYVMPRHHAALEEDYQ